jgi:bud site selection protein 31
MYYKNKEISKATYDFCLKNGYADAALIAKWKKVYICFIFLLFNTPLF